MVALGLDTEETHCRPSIHPLPCALCCQCREGDMRLCGIHHPYSCKMIQLSVPCASTNIGCTTQRRHRISNTFRSLGFLKTLVLCENSTSSPARPRLSAATGQRCQAGRQWLQQHHVADWQSPLADARTSLQMLWNAGNKGQFTDDRSKLVEGRHLACGAAAAECCLEPQPSHQAPRPRVGPCCASCLACQEPPAART